jgi:hypothetical protein
MNQEHGRGRGRGKKQPAHHRLGREMDELHRSAGGRVIGDELKPTGFLPGDERLELEGGLDRGGFGGVEVSAFDRGLEKAEEQLRRVREQALEKQLEKNIHPGPPD